ncbi:MAG TPA: nucleotide exchange factor GrpE [Ornithinimicrobium sp.]|uniref:nucleotide exchange factor GrpE n=1 Tax=Ornithinimicrobium sp. TaxID=1977084 RepID=UPI002B48FE6E|nr:nucleotide exchange factor GrpE [Ornithinimicrobium sp.]HKJ12416.1 nucleotide exchange factor GrpE [Ornithinimicrobium sp.]
MSQPNGAGEARPEDEGGPTGPVIRDKRKVDPQTGAVRDARAAQQAGEQTDAALEDPFDAGPPAPGADDVGSDDVDDADEGADVDAVQRDGVESAEVQDEPVDSQDEVSSDARMAAERLEDLRRLQAEFVNYRRRIDRDRAKDRDVTIGETLEAMLPVLDDIHSARQHGDVSDGPFAAIVDKLESTLGRQGAVLFGAVGDTFDPAVHEALMHVPDADLPDGATETTVVQVIQPGFQVGERLVRAARVAVADPTE